MTPEGRIVERVVYDPYGRGRHHYAADYDGNGAVEVPDLNGTYGHLTAWFADDMQADWDRNGTTNGDTPDIFAFQTDWFAQSGNAVAAGQISRRYAAGSGINANAPDNMIGYCGYVFNPETDDYTVRFRHYDPEIGRWLERDPLEGADWSAYSYALGNPDDGDPYGLEKKPPRKSKNTGPGGQGPKRDKKREAKREKSLQQRREAPRPTTRTPEDARQVGRRVTKIDVDCMDPCKLTHKASGVTGAAGAVDLARQVTEHGMRVWLEATVRSNLAADAQACVDKKPSGYPVVEVGNRPGDPDQIGESVFDFSSSQVVCYKDACEAAIRLKTLYFGYMEGHDRFVNRNWLQRALRSYPSSGPDDDHTRYRLYHYYKAVKAEADAECAKIRACAESSVSSSK